MTTPDIMRTLSPRAPAFSIVMPVYNAAATLEASIRSVLAQSLRDFELIAVDDGSSDDSLLVLLAMAAKDDRVRVLSRRNGGVSSARNLGIETASAPLIAFLDADDIWDREKLACHAALHRAEPGLAASFARIAFIAADAPSLHGATTCSSLTAPRPDLLDLLGENPVCTASNLVVRRDWCLVGGGFDTALGFAEDQDFVAAIVHRGGSIAGIDRVLTGYRFSPDGLSMDLTRMQAGWRLVVDRYVRDPAARAALEALYCRYLARRALRSGRRPLEALRYVLDGLRLDARSFLAERRRGISTVLAALAAPLLPASLRLRLFA